MYHKLYETVSILRAVGRLWQSGGGGSVEKQEIVLNYITSHDISCLIETGTYVGDMVSAVRRCVTQVYSVELDPYLFKVCRLRFLFCRNVTVLHGDSGFVLEQLLPRIRQRALFWLDGHFSGDITAKGTVDSPIIRELECIRRHHIKNHVILVDDVNYFGTGNWPSLEEVIALIKSINPKYDVEIENDILRAHVPDLNGSGAGNSSR